MTTPHAPFEMTLATPLACWHESLYSARTDLVVALAEEGAFIATARPLPVGTRVFLELSLGRASNAARGEIDAIVVEGAYGERPGFRVRFVDLDDALRTWIARTVAPPVVDAPHTPAPILLDALAPHDDEAGADVDARAPLADEERAPLADEERASLVDEERAPLVDEERASLVDTIAVDDERTPLGDDSAAPHGDTAAHLDEASSSFDPFADVFTPAPVSADGALPLVATVVDIPAASQPLVDRSAPSSDGATPAAATLAASALSMHDAWGAAVGDEPATLDDGATAPAIHAVAEGVGASTLDEVPIAAFFADFSDDATHADALARGADAAPRGDARAAARTHVGAHDHPSPDASDDDAPLSISPAAPLDALALDDGEAASLRARLDDVFPLSPFDADPPRHRFAPPSPGERAPNADLSAHSDVDAPHVRRSLDDAPLFGPVTEPITVPVDERDARAAWTDTADRATEDASGLAPDWPTEDMPVDDVVGSPLVPSVGGVSTEDVDDGARGVDAPAEAFLASLDALDPFDAFDALRAQRDAAHDDALRAPSEATRDDASAASAAQDDVFGVRDEAPLPPRAAHHVATLRFDGREAQRAIIDDDAAARAREAFPLTQTDPQFGAFALPRTDPMFPAVVTPPLVDAATTRAPATPEQVATTSTPPVASSEEKPPPLPRARPRTTDLFFGALDVSITDDAVEVSSTSELVEVARAADGTVTAIASAAVPARAPDVPSGRSFLDEGTFDVDIGEAPLEGVLPAAPSVDVAQAVAFAPATPASSGSVADDHAFLRAVVEGSPTPPGGDDLEELPLVVGAGEPAPTAARRDVGGTSANPFLQHPADLLRRR